MKWIDETLEQRACAHDFVKRGDLKECTTCHTWRRGLHPGELIFALVFFLVYKGTGH